MSTDTARRLTGETAHAPRDRVRLVVWGAGDADRRMAETDARRDQRVCRYRVVDVVQAKEPSTPSGDLVAIARSATYDRAWAAYRIPEQDWRSLAQKPGPARV